MTMGPTTAPAAPTTAGQESVMWPDPLSIGVSSWSAPAQRAQPQGERYVLDSHNPPTTSAALGDHPVLMASWRAPSS
jgi:hypothetical protein